MIIEKIKKFILFLKKPSQKFIIVIFFVALLSGILSILSSEFLGHTVVTMTLMCILGITFFYSLYLFIAFEFKF